MKADQQVLQTVLANCLPGICQLLRLHDIELSLITVNWFLTLFSNVVNFKVLLRIWDLLFFEGSIILFQITIGLLKLKGKLILFELFSLFGRYLSYSETFLKGHLKLVDISQ